MNRIRVVVLTTTGPSIIERITAEDPAVSSVVCLSGKAVALPISRAYDAFVRDPTGVVQRHFGHSALRIDVSAPIADGFSGNSRRKRPGRHETVDRIRRQRMIEWRRSRDLASTLNASLLRT